MFQLWNLNTTRFTPVQTVYTEVMFMHNTQARCANGMSRSPVAQEDGQIKGFDDAVLVKVRGIERRAGLGRPPASEKFGEVRSIDVAVAIHVARRRWIGAEDDNPETIDEGDLERDLSGVVQWVWPAILTAGSVDAIDEENLPHVTGSDFDFGPSHDNRRDTAVRIGQPNAWKGAKLWICY